MKERCPDEYAKARKKHDQEYCEGAIKLKHYIENTNNMKERCPEQYHMARNEFLEKYCNRSDLYKVFLSNPNRIEKRCPKKYQELVSGNNVIQGTKVNKINNANSSNHNFINERRLEDNKAESGNK